MNYIDYLLAPFVFIIREIFLFSYSLTGNYGISIILLSFAISLLLLPIFIFIERARKRDDVVKRKMKPVLDEIKRSYRGQERYYYIRTLHRQHGYSSLRSLVPLLSLLLQIPFFIAAYQFLEHFEPLAGQGFLMIDDLSAPDRLLGSINLLPIIMTLVNLVTAYFYTRNGDTAERKQMLVVAGVFLVLLYNFPSGLVLYWTMNNVFSFFRLFVTNPEVFRKSESVADLRGTVKATLRVRIAFIRARYPRAFRFYYDQIRPRRTVSITVFSLLLLLILASQLQWALQHTFDDFMLRLIVAPVAALLLTISIITGYAFFKAKQQSLIEILIMPEVYFSILFLTVYFYFGSRYYFSGVNPDLGILAFVFMLAGQVVGMIYFIHHYKKSRNRWSVIASIALIIVLIYQCIQSVVFITGRDIKVSILNLVTAPKNGALVDIVLPGILFIFIVALFIPARKNKKDRVVAGSGWSVYILALLYLLGFIFLWNPLEVFSSYPSNFDFTAFDILKKNFKIFAAALFILSVIYYFIHKKARYRLLLILISAVILGFIHNTLLPIHVGTLQYAVFLEQQNLAKPVDAYLLEAFGILVIFFSVRWLFKQKYHKQLGWALIALNIVLVTQSLVVAGRSGSFFQKENPPPDPSSSISFSKDKENIVLLVLDMFHGWYVNRTIEEVPDLNKIYDGFVWYPNSLAVSNITGSSIGPILGGYEHTIDQLNQDNSRTLEEKITTIAADFNTKIRNRGYRYSGNHIIYTIDDSLTYDTFLPKWHEDWDIYNNKLNIGVAKEVSYTLLWSNAMFFTAPLVFKPKIYNKGQWMQGEVTTNENTSRTMPYNFLRLLPHISDSKSRQSNFIYLYSSATHHPWDIMDEKGIIQTDVTPYENNKWALETLSEWIEWMKKNEVYDNTKIIVVSDHGPHWWYFKGEVDSDIPVIPHTSIKKINEASMSLFSLMLVKDFHAKGALQKDSRFMSNADASAIIFNENDPTKEEPPQSRTLPSSEVLWERKLWEMNQLRIIKQFEVTDDMYNLNNWKIVD
jgi:YidC/Oxa1 family membrane protein insertase